MSHASPPPIRSDERHRRRPPSERFELLQLVYLRSADPARGLARGECGTIVETFDEPETAYLVEFIDEDGSTKVEAAFTPDQLSAAPPLP